MYLYTSKQHGSSLLTSRFFHTAKYVLCVLWIFIKTSISITNNLDSAFFKKTQELAKRCQQCREIIIAAKEKQEGEAKKNADCLLEQIEQEEEERANREAMQARKRERKRMKRKAKQEKERQVKGINQTHTDCNVDASSRSNTTAETNENKRTNQDRDEQFRWVLINVFYVFYVHSFCKHLR